MLPEPSSGVSSKNLSQKEAGGPATNNICGVEHPDKVAVKITFVPSGIFITEFPETTPADGFTETPEDATKFTVYVVPLQSTPETPTKDEVAQGSMQFAGEVRVTETTQFPLPAVKVTSVPIGMPETTLPLTPPAEAVTIVDGFTTKATEYVPEFTPSQMPLLVVKLGKVQSEGSGQEAGEIAVPEIEQLPLVAVTITSVPIGIFTIESPTIFPAEDVSVPLETA